MRIRFPHPQSTLPRLHTKVSLASSDSLLARYVSSRLQVGHKRPMCSGSIDPAKVANGTLNGRPHEHLNTKLRTLRSSRGPLHGDFSVRDNSCCRELYDASRKSWNVRADGRYRFSHHSRRRFLEKRIHAARKHDEETYLCYYETRMSALIFTGDLQEVWVFRVCSG